MITSLLLDWVIPLHPEPGSNLFGINYGRQEESCSMVPSAQCRSVCLPRVIDDAQRHG
jgi:hypothetical protein